MVKFYQISLSLPFKPLKIHCYIFRFEKDPNNLLLLDSGVNRKETLIELERGIKKIDSNLSIESIEWIIPSHAHIDHIGGIQLIKDKSNAKIIIHKDEYEFIKKERASFLIDESFRQYGIPKGDIEQFHNHLNYYQNFNCSFSPDIFIEGENGNLPMNDEIEYIRTPGHSPNHIALLLRNEKSIFSGDTILSRITPNLGFSSNKANPVSEYIETLNKFSQNFNGWTAYPSHQEIISNINERADTLLFLLQERLDSVKQFFSENGKGIASLIKFLYPSVWNMPQLRFLALMETHSYIKYFYGDKSPFTPPFEVWE